MRQNNSVCSFDSSDSWVILSPIEQSIKRKIEAIGTPLKDWDIQINYGIKTGYNEAFIIGTEKRNEILANCSTPEERARTEELIRPILRGRDIKRYSYEWANLYLIATFPSRHYDIEQYPAVKNYLLSFGMERLEQTGETHIVNGEIIKARKLTNNKWFETQDSISYLDLFIQPKLLYSEIVREPQFYYDSEGVFFPEATTFIISGNHLQYLYHFFNSEIVTYFFKRFYAGGGLGNDGFRYKKAFFDKLPVPLPNAQSEQMINNVVEKDVEKQIMNLYRLSDSEIHFILSQCVQ